MRKNKKEIVWVRKEIRLPKDIMDNMELLAEEDHRVIKQYMEKVLTKHSEENPRKKKA